MNLGEKISSQRKTKGLSQEMLAENCGVSLRTIQRVENNKSVPRLYTLKVISDTLNLKFEELNIEETPNHSLTFDDATLSKISLINSSALTGALIPLFNIIAPVFFWRLYKSQALINTSGKRIISFQILWSLVSVCIISISHILHYKLTGEFITGRVPVVLIVYILLSIINVVFIIKNAIRLKQGTISLYSSIPSLF